MNALKLSFKEGAVYSRERISRLVANEKVVDCVFEFCELLRRAIESYVYRAYASVGIRVESDPPRVVEDKLTFGDWVGTYCFECGDTEVIVEVYPKVGKEAYVRMFRELKLFIEMLGPSVASTVSKVIFGSNPLYKAVVYTLLSALETLKLLSKPPVETVIERVTSGRVVGHLDVDASLKELARFRLVSAKLEPKLKLQDLAPAAALHAVLLSSILRLSEAALEHELKPLEDALRINAEMLSIPVLQEALKAVGEVDFSPDSIHTILLESYKEGVVPAYKPFEDRGIRVLTLPLPSAKVYEMWVLSLMARELGEVEASATPTSITLYGSDVTIYYNAELREKGRVISRVLGKGPRPDYIVNYGGKNIVVDAKYRQQSRVRVGDMERVLAYAVEYGDVINESLMAFLVTLAPAEVRSFSASLNGCRICVGFVVADPRLETVSVVPEILHVVRCGS